MKSICIFIPLYNGKKYIPLIEQEIKSQQTDNVKLSHKYLLTDTNDGSEEELKKIGAEFEKIKPSEFSHSLTREKAIMRCDTDIAIMMTQDCRMVNTDCVLKLSSCINDEIKFAYLRQVNSNRTIEKYTREINYPPKTIIKDKNSIPLMGINTFFASDAFAAYDVKFFKDINGYDGKNLPTNEDMYYAHKVIMKGYKVEYCADTFVDHTHKFSLKQIYKRYYLVGAFFGQNPVFINYKASLGGISLALKTMRLILKEGNIKAFLSFIPNMFARFFGKKRGEKNGKRM